MSRNQKFALFLGCAMPPLLAGIVVLLSYLGGPYDDGVRCERSQTEARCIVARTRFFGLFGNSEFAIPESAIRSATSVCATGHASGRGSASCSVYLMLDSGQFAQMLVSSYALASQANIAAERLNAYFKDKSAVSIEIGESLLTPLLFVGVAPLVLGLVILALRWLRLRRTGASTQGTRH